MFKCLSLKTAGHESHLITGEHSDRIMCLPRLLMDAVIIKGDTIKLSVISAAPWHLYSVRYQIHITGCDVMYSLLCDRAADQRLGRYRAQWTGLCDKGEITVDVSRQKKRKMTMTSH